jgi:3-deoxy-D-manno-octulosonic-acid transferase
MIDDQKRTSPHFLLKMLRAQKKNENYEREVQSYIQRKVLQNNSILISKKPKDQEIWNDVFQVLKENNCQSRVI